MDKSDKVNILAIGPHPDDIEIGCAGTLIKYKQNGHNIFMAVMTDGCEGGDKEVRKNEQINSSKIIGVDNIFFGEYEDTTLRSDKILIKKIEEIVSAVQPDFIFVNYSDDTHQDHRALSEATISATRHIKNVLFFEVPTTRNFTPAIFVDISPVIQKKIDALNAHSSQVLKTNVDGLSIVDVSRASATFRGIQGRVSHAEGFVPLRLFINM